LVNIPDLFASAVDVSSNRMGMISLFAVLINIPDIMADTFTATRITGQNGWNLPGDDRVNETIATGPANTILDGDSVFRIFTQQFNSGFDCCNPQSPVTDVKAGEAPDEGLVGGDTFEFSFWFRTRGQIPDGSAISLSLWNIGDAFNIVTGTADPGKDRNNYVQIISHNSGGGGLLVRGIDGVNLDHIVPVVSNLALGLWHYVRVVTTYVVGQDNDVVTVWVDQAAPVSFKTWEAYHYPVLYPASRVMFTVRSNPASFDSSFTSAGGFDFDKYTQIVYNISTPDAELSYYATSFETV
jgi:hypothetical protein